MIKLTIGKRNYYHPSKIEEVTLNHWINLNSKEDELEAFAKFAKIPHKTLLSLPPDDVYYHIDQVTKMLQIEKEHIKAIDVPSFKIGKSTYIVDKDFGKASIGRYLDATGLLGQLKEYEFYPYMLALYCLKEGEKPFTDGAKLDKRAKEMRKLDVLTALNINGFFLTLSKAYQKTFLAYLEGNPPKHRSKLVLMS